MAGIIMFGWKHKLKCKKLYKIIVLIIVVCFIFCVIAYTIVQIVGMEKLKLAWADHLHRLHRPHKPRKPRIINCIGIASKKVEGNNENPEPEKDGGREVANTASFTW
jgi:hypothetical protein